MVPAELLLKTHSMSKKVPKAKIISVERPVWSSCCLSFKGLLHSDPCHIYLSTRVSTTFRTKDGKLIGQKFLGEMQHALPALSKAGLLSL